MSYEGWSFKREQEARKPRTLHYQDVLQEPIEVMGLWLEATVSVSLRLKSEDSVPEVTSMDDVNRVDVYLNLHCQLGGAPPEFRFKDDRLKLDQTYLRYEQRTLSKAFQAAVEAYAVMRAAKEPLHRWSVEEDD